MVAHTHVLDNVEPPGQFFLLAKVIVQLFSSNTILEWSPDHCKPIPSEGALSMKCLATTINAATDMSPADSASLTISLTCLLVAAGFAVGKSTLRPHSPYHLCQRVRIPPAAIQAEEPVGPLQVLQMLL